MTDTFFSSPLLSSAVTASRSPPPSISLMICGWPSLFLSTLTLPGFDAVQEASLRGRSRSFFFFFFLNARQSVSTVGGENCEWTKEKRERMTCRGRVRSNPLMNPSAGTQRRQSERRRTVASECAASILRLLQTVVNACCQPRQCDNSRRTEQRLAL